MAAGPRSGKTSAGPYAIFDLATRTWRTLRRSARGASMSSLKTWPASGMTSGGRLYELPTWEAPTSATDGSESQFPMPKASDGPHGGPNQRSSKGKYDALPGMVVNLLPTPIARDWKSGTLALGVKGRPLGEVVLLLKTPTAQLGTNGSAQHPDKRRGGGHGPTLDDEVSFLLPHADSGGRDGGGGDEPEPQGRDEPANGCHSPAEWWGEYLPAIRRWEELSGVPAPAPTEIGPRGGRRLAARFAEWLMGVPGHVTNVPGLDRSQQLHKIGNGAMPQQAYVAYEHIHRLMKEAA